MTSNDHSEAAKLVHISKRRSIFKHLTFNTLCSVTWSNFMPFQKTMVTLTSTPENGAKKISPCPTHGTHIYCTTFACIVKWGIALLKIAMALLVPHRKDKGEKFRHNRKYRKTIFPLKMRRVCYSRNGLQTDNHIPIGTVVTLFMSNKLVGRVPTSVISSPVGFWNKDIN